MGLVTCPACASQISECADACPHCGEPNDDVKPVQRPPRLKRRVFRRHMIQRPGGATGIFVLGLLGLLLCGILGVFAWAMGSDYERRCRQMGVSPDGLAVAGKVMGLIATLFLVVQILLVLMWLGVIGAASAVR